MQAEQLELPRDHTIPAVNATQLLPYRALLSQYCYNSLINFKFAKTAVNQVGTTDRVTADTPFIGELENNENFPLTDRGLTLPTIVTLVLLTVLAALVAGASPAFAQGTVPEAPDQPIGTAVFVGGVDLEWNDVPGADSYDVQLYRNGQWLDLPGDGVEIAFYGAGAIISGLDPNSTLWFQVRAKNAQGFSDWSNVSSMASTNQFRLGRRARSAGVPASGTPVVHGTAQVGESLTADTTGIEDGNGLDRVQFRFQWATNDGSADTAIAGATNSTYTLAGSDEGKTIKVRVAFTDRGGYAESLTSAATATVAAAPNSPATGAPVISGTAEVGNTLTADTSDIADADGLSGATFTYQWIANDGTADTDKQDATDSTYTLVAADEGKTIKMRVSFTDDAGNGETLTSAVTAEVAARPNSPATGAPTISGTTQVGEALTADTSGIGDADGLTNVSYSHQWIRNDGSSDTSITDATDSTYTLVDADEGKTIKVRVSFTDDDGYAESLTSTATEAVSFAVHQQIDNNPATGGPTISGTAQVGETLTADTSGIADTDGLTNVSYSHQWIANDGNSYTDITSATESTYTLLAADEGKTIKVEVSFTDDAGYDETLTSAATGAVAGAVAAAPSSYITVAVTEDSSDSDNIVTNFTVTWSDSDDCSTNYNIYLAVSPSGNEAEISRTHLGSAASGSTQATPAISFRGQPFLPTLELYCGAYDAGSSQNVLVASTELFRRNFIGLREGTYSSAPLTALTISSGTLSPDFDRGIYSYAAELPSDVEVITLDPAVLTGYQADFVKNPSGWIWSVCRLSAYCTYYYGDGRTTGIVLSDADTNTYGFQVNLDRGENRLGISVNGGSSGVGPPKFYSLTVTVQNSPATVQNSPATVQNSPATGQPTISGTAQVGETLTADTSGISDVDGLDNVSYSYQWLSSRDTEISGATNDSYALVSADEGKYIKVRVTFTDDVGYEESLTSAATGAVSPAVQGQPSNTPATGDPTINGTAQVGETLTADTSDIADADGLSGATYSYQWVANNGTSDTDITGGTDSAYTLVAADEGKIIKVKVSFTDDAGNGETLTSAVTAEVVARPNSPATGAPDITGTVQVGETLTADTSSIADTDGLVNVSYGYQWIANDGTSDTNITGATDSTYTLISADEGQTIKVRVSFTDDDGNQEMLTSAPTAVVAAPAQVDSENEPSELSHLTVVVTEDDSDPGDVVSTFTITWNDAEDCSASYNAYLDGVVGEPIHLGSAASEGGQIAGSLTNVSAETFGFNANLHCGTIGSGRLVDRLWIPEYNRSIGTLPISRAYLPKPGTYSTEPGLIALTVSSGTLTPAFHNQTLNYTVPDVPNADGRFTLTTTAKADYYNVAFIPGSYYTFFSVCSYGGQQTSLSYGDDAGNLIYPLTDADANTPGFQMDLDEGENVFYIRVWPNCETGQLYKLTVTRAASAPANTPATGAPTIGGTARVGQPLTADTTGIADSDGLENATFAYQWLADDTEIDGATHSTYTLVVADEGQTIKVEVSFTDDADNEETLTSTATAEVAAGAPTDPPAKPRNLTGTANADGTVTLRWDAPNDDSVSGYQILRRRPREGENTLLVLVNDTGSTDTEYTDNDVTPDVGHAYRVKAINAVGLGRQSNFVNVTPTQPAGPAQNSPATGTPTISGMAQVGETLTADTSGIGDDDGLANVTFSYQWIASDGAVDIDITSATVSSYTPVDADEGQTIQVQVSFTDDAGNDESLTSAATAPVPARPNTPATGAPTIGGTAQVGETLAADTSGIADTDGLTNVTYSYQWLGDDTGIAGATSSTYTLAETDEGKTIKVRVSFTDDRGNSETGTSAATAVVAVPEPPAKPTGLSAVVSHDTVTLTWDDPQDDSITGYVILRRDRAIHPTGTFVTIAGDTGSADTTYTDETVEPDKQYVYRIEAINEHGKVSEISDWVRADTPVAPVPDKPTGLSAVVSHDTVTLTWDDPQDDTITGYVILRRDREIHPTGTFVTIAGDTGSADTTYTDDTVEPDKQYVYRIKAINEHGEMSEKSHWLRTDTPNWATGAPTIGGNAQVGETLTAGISEIADDDGLENAVFSYQWVASSGTTDTNIAAATDSTYDLVAADAGKTIKVRVSFTDDAGNEETLTSTATNTVTYQIERQISNSPATGAPSVTGTAQVGDTLTADTSSISDDDGLTKVSYQYQWIRNDGTSDAEIAIATDSTYALADDDEGNTVKVRVSFTDDAGTDESLTSPATATVAARISSPATGVPSVTGTAQVGRTLTADTSGIADDDGLTNVSYSYQWVRTEINDSEHVRPEGSDYGWVLRLISEDIEIAGATNSTYTLVAADGRYSPKNTIKVRVSFTDDKGNEETLSSTSIEVSEKAITISQPYEPPQNEDSPVEHAHIFPLVGSGYGPDGRTWELEFAVGPLVPDDDATTKDYIINYRIVDENGDPLPNCEGDGLGGSLHFMTVSDQVGGNQHSGEVGLSCRGAYFALIEVLDANSNFIDRSVIDVS